MLVRHFDEMAMNGNEASSGKELLGGGIHPYAEVFYVSTGRAMLDWIGTTYQAEAPALFLVASNTPHHFFRLSPIFRCWFIEVELETLDENLSQASITAWNELQARENTQPQMLPMLDTTLYALYETLKRQQHEKISSLISREIVALDLKKLFLLIKDATTFFLNKNGIEDFIAHERLRNPSAQEQIGRIVRYIETAYTTDINLADLSDRFGFTSSYIIKIFKEQVGLTPMQYVQGLRLNAAISYLSATHLTIQSISERSGFLSQHYFSRLFKLKFGESPSQWREKSRANPKLLESCLSNRYLYLSSP